MPSAETSNQAVNHAAAQVIQILAGVVKLQDGNPEHLWLAVQMGEIMSPVFATHAISATVVPLQWFVSVPVWENITADDPWIQQHPLKDKARAIFVSRPVPSTSATRVTKSVPGPGPSRPKPKLALKKKLAEGKADKGRGKEVVPPEDVQDVQGRGRTLAIEKRRRDSGSSEPLALLGALQSSFENATPPPATMLKKPKVAEVPLPPPADGLQEDVTSDMNAPEVVPHCDQCIKLSIICHQGYGAARAALKACTRCSRLKLECSCSKIDTAPMLKGQPRHTRSSSHHCPPTQDILMEGEAAAPHAPAYSLLPIATLSPNSHSPDPAQPSLSTTLDPPRESVVPSLQHSMEVYSEGDAMVNDLQVMTLEVMNDNVALLSKWLGLQDTANGVQAELVKLQARCREHSVHSPAEAQFTEYIESPVIWTSDQSLQSSPMKPAQTRRFPALSKPRTRRTTIGDAPDPLAYLQKPIRPMSCPFRPTPLIATQNADICALHNLCSNMEVVQNQVKVLQEESVTQDETLRQAQAQLARQQQATGVLQDTYNALHHCILGHNQPLSPPFPSPVYHANPPYSGNHSMMPVSMGQMQAMESLYFNLPTGASAMGGPSAGNIAGGSGWNGTGGPSAGRSHNQITSSSRTGAHAFGKSASGRGPQN
ncbi:hypothetical protein EDB19DRAFT_1912756 [Suillus lakei]|nr:hypothetical protein EDB19DRAFT_1912756 [Suillus lakei]